MGLYCNTTTIVPTRWLHAIPSCGLIAILVPNAERDMRRPWPPIALCTGAFCHMHLIHLSPSTKSLATLHHSYRTPNPRLSLRTVTRSSMRCSCPSVLSRFRGCALKACVYVGLVPVVTVTPRYTRLCGESLLERFVRHREYVVRWLLGLAVVVEGRHHGHCCHEIRTRTTEERVWFTWLCIGRGCGKHVKR